MKIKYCKECNSKITRGSKSGFCLSCARSGKRNPFYGRDNSGDKNPTFIDGRTTIQYYCKICSCKISVASGYYGEGYCARCAKLGDKSFLFKDGRCKDIKTYMKNYRLNRRNTDLSYKLKEYLRCRIREALKHNYKSVHTMELIGCSIEFLKSYIESKFQIGMTWENYGRFGWHIDHIQPCSSFDLSKPENQKICFNYSNLQPLWFKENLLKGAKV